jgi:hypothetical protein
LEEKRVTSTIPFPFVANDKKSVALARPRLRPARHKGITVGLGAASVGRSGLALAGPIFAKDPDHCPRVINILPSGLILRAFKSSMAMQYL